jgi:hypothetical protein
MKLISFRYKAQKSGRLKPDHDKTILQRRIDAPDSRIDRLVYELYGLTDEDIKIVEKTE